MKKTMDKVVDFLQKENKDNELSKVFYRPSKEKSLVGVVFSFVLFLLMCLLCVTSFTIGYFIVLLASIALLTFYGLNAFSKDGFIIQRYISKKYLDRLENDDDKDEEME